MGQNNMEKELRIADFILVLKRCWLIALIAFAVVFVALFAYFSATYVPMYSSTSTLYFLSNSQIMQDGESNSAYYQLDIGASLAADCMEIAFMDDPVLLPVLNSLPEEYGIETVEDLKKVVTAKYSEESRFIYFVATTENSEQSAHICNLFASQVSVAFNDAQTDGTWKIVQVMDTAKTSDLPSNSVSLTKIGLISAIVALLIYVVYFVIFLLDDRINTQEHVERYLGVNVLGVIPNRDERSQKGSYYSHYSYGKDTSHSEGGEKNA